MWLEVKTSNKIIKFNSVTELLNDYLIPNGGYNPSDKYRAVTPFGDMRWHGFTWLKKQVNNA